MLHFCKSTLDGLGAAISSCTAFLSVPEVSGCCFISFKETNDSGGAFESGSSWDKDREMIMC